MAVCEFHLNQNNALGKMAAFTAIVPDDKPGPFPVLYLLHGLSDDHTAWTRRSGIENHVMGLPLIVVMPDGGRGFYTDARDNPRAAFETNIVQDIVGFVDRTFRTVPARESRALAGLSMGGYGAFKLALKHPGLFCAAVSHSGALGFARRDFSRDDDWGREWRPVFGDAPAGGPDDVFALAQMTSSRWHRSLTPRPDPPCASTAAWTTSSSKRTAPCTRTWTRWASRTSTRNTPASTTGSIGTFIYLTR